MKLFEDRVVFGFSDNADGNLDFRFDNKEVVNKRRKEFFIHENIDPKSTIVMIAEHKNNIVNVSREDSGKGVYGPEDQYICDGLVTRGKGLNLAISVADCIALALYDKKNETLAMVHVGSKNLAIGTVGRAIETIKDGRTDSEIFAVTGPFIKKCCYEFDKIPPHLKTLKKYFIRETETPYHLDMESTLVDQLLEGGIRKENIQISPLCSKHDNFPSHKRSQKESLPESRMLVYARIVV